MEGELPPLLLCWDLCCRQVCQLGSITLSITWIRPLLATKSVLVTFALSTIILPSITLMVTSFPFTVFAELRNWHFLEGSLLVNRVGLDRREVKTLANQEKIA
jgi:hypothetical protein